ncbi:MAG: O-antigen ligase family protein [Candidatus Omnitrophica bacterium]|nr:O-antigen ligase family protein [Candidatus Omnitrophota bacterium]
MRKWEGLAQILQQGGLYALLFLLPFSKAACEISFGFLFAGWLIDRLNPRTRRDTIWITPATHALRLWIWTFLLVSALSILRSDYPMLGLRGFFSKWAEYFLFFVITADVVRRPGVVGRVLLFMTLGAVGVTLEAYSQWFRLHGLFRHYRYDMFDKMIGPYENPNDFATYLIVVIPVLLSTALRVRWVVRVGLGVLLTLLLVCFLQTGTIAAYLGIMCSLPVIFSMHLTSRRFVGPLLGMLLLSTAATLIYFSSVKDLVMHFQEIQVNRIAWLKSSLAMIRDRPFLGFGLNTFLSHYMDYWVGGIQVPVYAHNCYLQIAAETGLIGLVMFLAVVMTLMRKLLTVARRLKDHKAVLLLGLIAGLTAYLVQAAFDTNFFSLRQAVLFWVMAGIALGISDPAEQRV